MKHYFLKVYFNFASWAFIGIAFVVAAILAEQMGIASTTSPIVGIAGFINSAFVFATLLGLGLMTLFTQLTSRIIINRRLRKRGADSMKHFISDQEAAEMFVGEILSQLNGIANLALVICLLTLLDRALGNKIFANPAVELSTLACISFTLYVIAFGVFYGTLKPVPVAAGNDAA